MNDTLKLISIILTIVSIMVGAAVTYIKIHAETHATEFTTDQAFKGWAANKLDTHTHKDTQ